MSIHTFCIVLKPWETKYVQETFGCFLNELRCSPSQSWWFPSLHYSIQRWFQDSRYSKVTSLSNQRWTLICPVVPNVGLQICQRNLISQERNRINVNFTHLNLDMKALPDYITFVICIALWLLLMHYLSLFLNKLIFWPCFVRIQN